MWPAREGNNSTTQANHQFSVHQKPCTFITAKMGKDKSEKKEKKDKKEKRSEVDGVSKKSKKEKKSKLSDANIEAAVESVTNSDDAAVTTMEVEVVKDTSGELVVKPVGALVPFANPLADEKVAKKVLKSVKKGNSP